MSDYWKKEYAHISNLLNAEIKKSLDLNDELEKERERSKKLIEALEYISEWNSVELREVAEEALKEYRGEK